METQKKDFVLQITHIFANRIEELFLFGSSLQHLYSQLENTPTPCIKGFTLFFPNGTEQGSKHPINCSAYLYDCLTEEI
jgi:hypothetical protein